MAEYFTCPSKDCGRRIRSSAALSRHVKKVHPEIKHYTRKSYSREASLWANFKFTTAEQHALQQTRVIHLNSSSAPTSPIVVTARETVLSLPGPVESNNRDHVDIRRSNSPHVLDYDMHPLEDLYFNEDNTGEPEPLNGNLQDLKNCL